MRLGQWERRQHGIIASAFRALLRLKGGRLNAKVGAIPRAGWRSSRAMSGLIFDKQCASRWRFPIAAAISEHQLDVNGSKAYLSI